MVGFFVDLLLAVWASSLLISAVSRNCGLRGDGAEILLGFMALDERSALRPISEFMPVCLGSKPIWSSRDLGRRSGI